MAESEEELKSLLMKGKEESEKVGLKLNIQKMKIMAIDGQAPPGSQASSRGEAKDSALLSSRDAGLLEPPKIKSDTVSTVSPSISHEVMGPDAVIVF